MRLHEDYKKLQQNLRLSDEVRGQAEDSLAELQKQYRSIKEAFTDRDELFKTYKRKFEAE